VLIAAVSFMVVGSTGRSAARSLPNSSLSRPMLGAALERGEVQPKA
jgi:hypothetical protein